MALDRQTSDLWVCPKSKQPLVYFESEGFFVCPASRLRYRVEDGVPVFLVDEATELSAAEIEHLMKRAKDLGLPGA